MEYAKCVAAPTIDENPQWLHARKIMGQNFFGVEEAIKYFGINPYCEQIADLCRIPFFDSTLERVKSTHILAAVFPISIPEIGSRVPGNELFYDQEMYRKKISIGQKEGASWQLIRKTPVEDSFSKSWQEQRLLIDDDEEIPTDQVLVYAIVGHHLATNDQLLKYVYVRTSSAIPRDTHIDVGPWGKYGLDVGCNKDDRRCSNMGISSARKF